MTNLEHYLNYIKKTFGYEVKGRENRYMLSGIPDGTYMIKIVIEVHCSFHQRKKMAHDCDRVSKYFNLPVERYIFCHELNGETIDSYSVLKSIGYL